MQDIQHVDSSELAQVTGGVSAWGATKLVGKAGGKLMGWPLTAGFAAYDAYQGGAAEYKRPGSTAGSIAKEASLEALNSVSMGASNLVLGRPQ